MSRVRVTAGHLACAHPVPCQVSPRLMSSSPIHTVHERILSGWPACGGAARHEQAAKMILFVQVTVWRSERLGEDKCASLQTCLGEPRAAADARVKGKLDEREMLNPIRLVGFHTPAENLVY